MQSICAHVLFFTSIIYGCACSLQNLATVSPLVLKDGCFMQSLCAHILCFTSIISGCACSLQNSATVLPLVLKNGIFMQSHHVHIVAPLSFLAPHTPILSPDKHTFLRVWGPELRCSTQSYSYCAMIKQPSGCLLTYRPVLV